MAWCAIEDSGAVEDFWPSDDSGRCEQVLLPTVVRTAQRLRCAEVEDLSIPEYQCQAKERPYDRQRKIHRLYARSSSSGDTTGVWLTIALKGSKGNRGTSVDACSLSCYKLACYWHENGATKQYVARVWLMPIPGLSDVTLLGRGGLLVDDGTVDR